MAQMAFYVQGAGVPVIGELGLAAGDFIFGFWTNGIRIYKGSAIGSTNIISVTSTQPFTIKDDPILPKLTTEAIDFQLSGVQAMWGDISMGLKIYAHDGSVGYDETRLVATRGTSIGGWSMTAIHLRQVPHSSDQYTFLRGMLGFPLA